MSDLKEVYYDMIDQTAPALLTLHKWITIGRGTRILTHCPYKGYSDNPYTTIRDFVWIGYNCIIQMGVTLGHACFIGAGSVVTKDCDEFGIYVGNPASLLRKRGGAEMLRTLCAKKMAETSGLVPDHRLDWPLITDKDVRRLFKLPRKVVEVDDPAYKLDKYFRGLQMGNPDYSNFTIWKVLEAYEFDVEKIKNGQKKLKRRRMSSKPPEISEGEWAEKVEEEIRGE